ncbi:MAG: hypothetical protein JSV96_03475 [Candidatus Aminicenantes bacterium]|nr:MAG: hypothetical protein JSV96_03475 [Candidatus Aminicenantes bacterium]
MSKKPKIAFNNGGSLGKGNDITDLVTNLSTSTNNIIINGLLERGFNEIYQFNSLSIRLDKNNTPIATVVKLGLDKKGDLKTKSSSMPLEYGESACFYSGIFQLELDEFDIIFIRGDDIEANPRFLEICEKAQKPLFINSPRGTFVTKDKFEIKMRADEGGLEIPYTLNISDFQELLYSLKEIPGKFIVIKARYGFGGNEVWRVTRETPEEELKKIFEECYGGAVVQEYKEIIEEGDLRLNVFDDDVLGNGAILRQTRGDTWKTNIDLGGIRSPFKIDESILKTIRRVSEAYPEVRLYGIDLFLDGTFIEINAYPTTIGYSQEYFGIKPEDIILDKLLQEI